MHLIGNRKEKILCTSWFKKIPTAQQNVKFVLKVLKPHFLYWIDKRSSFFLTDCCDRIFSAKTINATKYVCKIDKKREQYTFQLKYAH